MALALFAFETLPVSADEYGYNYLASTLDLGRFWNSPYPPALKDALRTYWIAQLDGKRFSQYPPGWPAVLSLFSVTGTSRYAAATAGTSLPK